MVAKGSRSCGQPASWRSASSTPIEPSRTAESVVRRSVSMGRFEFIARTAGVPHGLRRRAPRMTEWSSPPSTLHLGEGQIHVWRASLALPRGDMARAWALLSPEERRRALRMRFPVLRGRSVASRAILRTLLGRYLGVAAGEVPLTVEADGRPVLDATDSRVRFSVSHAGPLALYAFAVDRAVGVDVERMKREVPFDRLASRFFASAEV